jgi:hypothetical protein
MLFWGNGMHNNTHTHLREMRQNAASRFARFGLQQPARDCEEVVPSSEPSSEDGGASRAPAAPPRPPPAGGCEWGRWDEVGRVRGMQGASRPAPSQSSAVVQYLY